MAGKAKRLIGRTAYTDVHPAEHSAAAPYWSFTMDSGGYLTIRKSHRIVYEGTYEAFIADGDVRPPADIVDAIHARYEKETRGV